MGTGCITVFKDTSRGTGQGHEIAVLYRQCDGYPSDHGRELCNFLQGKQVVNGIPMGREGHVFNGAGGLAAQTVAHFANPEEAGGFYLFPAGTRDCGEEFTYTVRITEPDSTTAAGSIKLEVTGYDGVVLYSGNADDFDPDAYEE